MTNRIFILVLLLIPKITLEQRIKIYQNIDWPQEQSCSSWMDCLMIAMDKLNLAKKIGLDNLLEDLIEQLRRIERTDYICILDEFYPLKLHVLAYPPLVLFYQGNLDLLQTPCLAIVGARKNSSYGNFLLQSWIPSLNAAGLTIVSGLAEGIDAIAHHNTLKVGGRTIGVLGTGLNQIYPRHHKRLQQTIGEKGLVISEYLPNQGPRKYQFPQRNRLIAALSHCVLVVEARYRSGSLITADLALDLNRGVLTIPGRVDFALSRGCNELLVQGAQPVLSAKDVISAFNEYYWLN
ncbi:DNA-processing protein DprA [Weissella koreensis]|uniref:DNA-protecting protein DprA n=1 Tax=Weissella koreensis TaxID=165096 RepID=A0A7H1MKB2_9LACO|nr:DNA-processing protein DprA [Weissella koreensis]AVH74640.1 DNA-protecting protein DprA [Weissella koreensis]EJF33994.1 hypothetical protein JC2156_03020 [Weissella koreensis KCTC 3621]EJF34284.1 hypothetical protein JC2156_01660 [Weissella koreensis KCTC 3621]QGN19863.1 DNA-protecting protein DprA [Weissella koreensis]QNT63898.1 DNA-protecting protein DprA [Weissella koreensis]